MDKWYRRIPGFGTDSTWRQLTALIAYIVILILLIGGLQGNIPLFLLGLWALAIMAIGANVGQIRSRIPWFNSPNTAPHIGAWAGLGVVGMVLLLSAGAVSAANNPTDDAEQAQVQPTATPQAIVVQITAPLDAVVATPQPVTVTATSVPPTATITATPTPTPSPNDPARIREYSATAATFGTTMGGQLQRFSTLLINNDAQSATWRANMRRSLQEMNTSLATLDGVTPPPCLNVAHGHLIAAQGHFRRMTQLMGRAVDYMDVADYTTATPLITQSNAALNEGAEATQRATTSLRTASCS